MSAKRIDWEQIKRRLAEAEKNLAASLEFDERRKKDLLQRRAEYFAARRDAPTGAEETRSVMVFLLGNERYAVELQRLRQVISPDNLTPVPGSPPGMLGVMNFGGEVGTIWSLAHLLNLPKAESGAERHVIVPRAGFDAGFLVDYVEERREIDAGETLSADEMEGTLPSRFLKSLTRDKIHLLDMEAILESVFSAGMNA
ncbi:MAG: chemotaxis protein CheW, partial [Elusimicrobia bacterium]|nr:chemotaxis protein CheW [Elusimicrobiota bacterium]